MISGYPQTLKTLEKQLLRHLGLTYLASCAMLEGTNGEYFAISSSDLRILVREFCWIFEQQEVTVRTLWMGTCHHQLRVSLAQS